MWQYFMAIDIPVKRIDDQFIIKFILCLMTGCQKSLTISLVKVYNWREEADTQNFLFAFYSLPTNILILQKTVTTKIINAQLIINLSLKITYNSQENQVLLKMGKSSNGGLMAEIANFQIDLERLNEEQVQYLPFGKNQRVLKVVSGNLAKEQRKSKNPVIRNTSNQKNDAFIHERERFLKRVSATSPSVISYKYSMGEKSFTEKIYELLMQVKRFRNNKDNFNRVNAVQLDQYNFEYVGSQSQLRSLYAENVEKQLMKCNSENTIGMTKEVRQSNNNYNREVETDINDKISNTSMRNKLQLKDLNLVPINPQYDYDEEVVTSLQFPSANNKYHNHKSQGVTANRPNS